MEIMTNVWSVVTKNIVMRHQALLKLNVTALWILLVSVTSASAGELKSGVYENLAIAVGRHGAVVGVYKENQGEGVTKDCSFFLRGSSANNEARVMTWSDRLLPGTVKDIPGGVDLKINNGTDHAGCGLVLLPQISTGIVLELVRLTKWLDLQEIIAERAVLHLVPSHKGKLKGVLRKGALVGILRQKDGWMQVESVFEPHSTVGWIRSREAGQLMPPNSLDADDQPLSSPAKTTTHCLYREGYPE